MLYTIEVLNGTANPPSFEHDFAVDPTREEVIELIKGITHFDESAHSVDYYPKVVIGRGIINGNSFTESEMTDFANYCLSEYRESILLNPENVLRRVTEADFMNWKERYQSGSQSVGVPHEAGSMS